MKIILPLLLSPLFCLLFISPVPGQNPFLTPPSHEHKQSPQDREKIRQPSAPLRGTSPFFAKFLSLQRELRQKMTGYARQIQENPFGTATWQLMVFSLFYGIIHAAGPGHGKSIVCSYFLSRRGTVRQALMFGNMITATHIFSATVIVLGLYWILGGANIVAFHAVEKRLETISYLMIVLIGVFLLTRTFLDWWRADQHETEQCAPASSRDMVSLSLATGLMPCPGAALILLFTLSLDVFWAGLVAMVPLALGMGLTASALGMATVGSTRYALQLSQRSKRAFAVLHRSFAFLGALLVILLGASLYLGARF